VSHGGEEALVRVVMDIERPIKELEKTLSLWMPREAVSESLHSSIVKFSNSGKAGPKKKKKKAKHKENKPKN